MLPGRRLLWGPDMCGHWGRGVKRVYVAGAVEVHRREGFPPGSLSHLEMGAERRGHSRSATELGMKLEYWV